jgi:hypothetical protein
MTQLPPDELAALDGCYLQPGASLLELGNKKNSTGLYRDWYTDQGIVYECIDWNGLDGAWKFDMREQGMWAAVLDQFRRINFGGSHGRAQTVTNFGFTEHVGETLEEQHECWRNIHQLIQYNGALAICMPLMPHWKGHGRWMPTPDWYQEMAHLNGYWIRNVAVWDRVRPTFVATMTKRSRADWIAPTASEIVRSDL